VREKNEGGIRLGWKRRKRGSHAVPRLSPPSFFLPLAFARPQQSRAWNRLGAWTIPCPCNGRQKVLRHFVILEYLRQISFLISAILPPPPFSMLDFLSVEFASFLYNIEKGEGDGCQSKPDLK